MKILVGLLLVFLTSCVSVSPNAVMIGNVNNSVADIKKISLQAIGVSSYRIQSENGRELETEYYSRFKDNFDFDPEKSPERVFTKIQINGDRRPYEVYVSVVIEAKIKDAYEKATPDLSLTKKQARVIKQKLIESLAKRNVIDDFKPF